VKELILAPSVPPRAVGGGLLRAMEPVRDPVWDNSAIVKLLSAAATIVLFLVPGRTAWRVRATGESGDLAPIQFTGILLNACVWGLYGVAIRNMVPLSVANVIGVSSGSFCLVTFRGYGTAKQRDEAGWQIIAVASITAVLAAYFAELLIGGVEQSSGDPDLKLLGGFAMASSFALYMAPLSAMRMVIKKGSSESLSRTLTIASLVNATLFAAYGYFEADANVYIPGCCGAVLSCFQLAMIAIYPPQIAESSRTARLSMMPSSGSQHRLPSKIQLNKTP